MFKLIRDHCDRYWGMTGCVRVGRGEAVKAAHAVQQRLVL